MQQGNFPPNPYQCSPRAVPFSPYSQAFLRPRGPRMWQPSVRCSTPRHPGDSSDYSPASPSGSPYGSDNSDPHYIPLNSSHESSPSGQRGNGYGWTPKWKRRDGSAGSYNNFSPSPGERYNRNQGFGGYRGRGNKMNNNSPRGWQSTSGHSDNIRDYVSSRCFEDPWAELTKKLEQEETMALESTKKLEEPPANDS